VSAHRALLRDHSPNHAIKQSKTSPICQRLASVEHSGSPNVNIVQWRCIGWTLSAHLNPRRLDGSDGLGCSERRCRAPHIALHGLDAGAHLEVVTPRVVRNLHNKAAGATWGRPAERHAPRMQPWLDHYEASSSTLRTDHKRQSASFLNGRPLPPTLEVLLQLLCSPLSQ
jgi:hypothetical protein